MPRQGDAYFTIGTSKPADQTVGSRYPGPSTRLMTSWDPLCAAKGNSAETASWITELCWVRNSANLPRLLLRWRCLLSEGMSLVTFSGESWCLCFVAQLPILYYKSRGVLRLGDQHWKRRRSRVRKYGAAIYKNCGRVFGYSLVGGCPANYECLQR
jgi:hypothetical protein